MPRPREEAEKGGRPATATLDKILAFELREMSDTTSPSVCFFSGRRRHGALVKMAVCALFVFVHLPLCCRRIGLDWIAFYLHCSLFENLRCSPPNLRPQEEESKLLKFMRNPLSTCQHKGPCGSCI